MDTTEQKLAAIAEQAESDTEASAAMKRLREEFDPSYRWCYECDGLVVKDGQCCMEINSKAEQTTRNDE